MSQQSEQPLPGFTTTTEAGPSDAVLAVLAIMEKQLDIIADMFRPAPYVLEVPEENLK